MPFGKENWKPGDPLTPEEKRKLRFPGKHRTVDMGGGEGELMMEMALEHPDREYIVVDSGIKDIPGKPHNLHLISHRLEMGSGLPVPDHSVDEVHINFVMGEVRDENGKMVKATPEEIAVYYDFLLHYRTRANEDLLRHEITRREVANEVAVFARIIRDAKDALLPYGVLRITDVEGNIPFIQCVLEREGFEVIEIYPLSDKSVRTNWGKFFMEQYKNHSSQDRDPEDSIVRPMAVSARIVPEY